MPQASHCWASTWVTAVFSGTGVVPMVKLTSPPVSALTWLIRSVPFCGS